MALTIGGLLLQARGILNDTVPTSGSTRYSDTDLVGAFNNALTRARAIRPDIFLDMGMRATLPQYVMPADTSVPFPLDSQFYLAFVYYVCGEAELREDTFTDDKRAEMLLQRFTGQMMGVTG